jgi:hypothetical protein
MGVGNNGYGHRNDSVVVSQKYALRYMIALNCLPPHKPFLASIRAVSPAVVGATGLSQHVFRQRLRTLVTGYADMVIGGRLSRYEPGHAAAVA